MLPSVSIVIPIYNEECYIEQCLQSIITQDYSNIVEILCVDGGSQDRTTALVECFHQKHDKILLLANPSRVQAAGLNIGIQHAQGDIIARIDAHAFYATDYITQCVEHLLRTGAGCVGGTATPVAGESFVSQLIVCAHESRFGIGVAPFRRPSDGRWVDTVWPGCYWRRVVNEVGPYRAELGRDEDNDFHARLRAHHYGIYLAPTIKAFYFPRRTLKGICQQSFGNGRGVFPTLSINADAVSLRRFMPFLFVTSLLMTLLVAPWHKVGLMGFALLCGLYAICAALFCVPIGYNHGWRYAVVMPAVFVLIHLSYGGGTLWGLSGLIRPRCGRLQTNLAKTKMSQRC
jgi:succinoglycan biosynthesis protein ExoA